MRNLKIIRGLGMAFLIGGILTCKIISTTSTEITIAIVLCIAAAIIIPAQMISIDREYEKEYEKRKND